jgi:hypothetical protein
MTDRVDVYFKGEFIATGTRVGSPWAFWTSIEPHENLDAVAVIGRLKEIEKDFGARFEVSGSYLRFPPVFDVRKVETLA